MSIKRLNYFTGEFLKEEDFEIEQQYHIDMLRKHNKNLHGWGIAQGLGVGFNTGTAVTISQGLAIDSAGKTILLTDSQSYDFSATSGSEYYLSIKYYKTFTDEFTSETGATGFTRITEEPAFVITTNLPVDPSIEIVLAKIILNPDKTIQSLDLSERHDVKSALTAITLTNQSIVGLTTNDPVYVEAGVWNKATGVSPYPGGVYNGADIILFGQADGFDTLIPGAVYYLDYFGGLTTNVSTGIKIGSAVSSTEMIVDIDVKKQEQSILKKLPAPPVKQSKELNELKIFAMEDDYSTRLLIHSNDIDGSITFTDSSYRKNLLTPVGAVEHSTDANRFGSSAIKFDGSTSHLIVDDFDDLKYLRNTSFTFDFWFQDISSANGSALFSYGNDSTDKECFLLYFESDAILFSASSDGINWDISQALLVGGTSLTEFDHFAVSRIGNQFYTHKNGVQQGSYTCAEPSEMYNPVTAGLRIGKQYSGGFLNGYLDEVRISIGTIRWTDNFTPPTETYNTRGLYALDGNGVKYSIPLRVLT